MKVYKPAVLATGDEGEKIGRVYKEIYERFLSWDPFKILDVELNGSVSERLGAHDYMTYETRGWSPEEKRGLAERILRETPIIQINRREMRIFTNYTYSEEGKRIPLGTETHGRCVSVPLGLTGSVSIKDFCGLRGLDPSFADFQRHMWPRWNDDKKLEERERIEHEGLSTLAREAGVVIAMYYEHDPDLSDGTIDYEVEGYHVYSPDGTIYEIVKDEQAKEGEEKFTLKPVVVSATEAGN